MHLAGGGLNGDDARRCHLLTLAQRAGHHGLAIAPTLDLYGYYPEALGLMDEDHALVFHLGDGAGGDAPALGRNRTGRRTLALTVCPA